MTVETALGHLHRSFLLASTTIPENGAISLMCRHLTLQIYSYELVVAGFVGELQAMPCSRLFGFVNGDVSSSIWCTHLPVGFKGRRGSVLVKLVPGDTRLLFPRQPAMPLEWCVQRSHQRRSEMHLWRRSCSQGSARKFVCNNLASPLTSRSSSNRAPFARHRLHGGKVAAAV